MSLRLFLLLLMVSLISATSGEIAAQDESVPADYTIEIVAHVPPGTGTVYLTGNRPELGPWHPGLYAMEGGGDTPRRARLTVPEGWPLEFKFTLGEWEREALDENGEIPPNREIEATSDMSVEYDIAGFREGEDDEEAAPRRADVDVGRREVLGTLIVLGVVESEHLEEDRPVLVWLPPGYDEPENADRRYPVLYMHDGQNLFEPDKAFTGVDWGVDEAVVGLVEEGKMPPIIVVGVFSTRRRLSEYNPFKLGDDYARFLIEELKPRIDAGYRTRPEPRFTGTMGSSAGGLISVGLGWRHPDNFGRVGALSAHLPPIGEEMGGTGESLLDAIEATGLDRSLRIYVDQSTEGPDATYDYDSHRERFAAMLAGWGWTDGEDYMMRRFEDTRHTEADWRARLHIPLEFLFGDAGESDNGATGDQSSE